MEVRRILNKEQIISVLTDCGNDFFNQNFNNEESIQILSEKFYDFGIVFAAYFENDLAGFISFYANDYDSKRAFLSMIIIKNKYQRKGVATTLLNEMETFCKTHSFNEILSEVDDKNVKSKSYFLKNAFSVTQEKGQGTSFYLKKL